MNEPEAFVGIDVGKSRLSSCVLGAPGCHDLDNDETSIGNWLSSLPSSAVLAVESTGRYHLAVVRLAHARGHRVYVLNARDVRQGARGQRQDRPQ